jgi:hypothetical protein
MTTVFHRRSGGARLEDGLERIEAEQDPAGVLDEVGRDHELLGDDLHVAQAPSEQ